MKTKTLIFSVLMMVSIVAFAQPEFRRDRMQGNREHTFNGNKPEGRMQVAQALNLSDAQKEAFKKGMIDLHKQLLPIKNELGELKARQKSLVMAEKTDMGAINKNIEKMGQLQIEIVKIQTKHKLEMRNQLTEEQKIKFDMMKHSMKSKRGKR